MLSKRKRRIFNQIYEEARASTPDTVLRYRDAARCLVTLQYHISSWSLMPMVGVLANTARIFVIVVARFDTIETLGRSTRKL